MSDAGQIPEPSQRGTPENRARLGTAGVYRVGLTWAWGSWRLVAGLFFLDVLLTGLVAVPVEAVIQSALRDRPVEALFGVGWRVEMLAELVIVHRGAFVAGAWLLLLGLVAYWLFFSFLWGGLARAWSRGRRDLPSVFAGALERGWRVLVVRLLGLVALGAVLAVLWMALSSSGGASFSVRVAVVAPIMVVWVLVQGLQTYWWVDVAIAAGAKRPFLGSLVLAWKALFSWSGRGLWVHLGYLVLWLVPAGAAVLVLDPARTWSWPVWIVVLVVELCALARFWLRVATVVSEAAVLRVVAPTETR